MKIIAITTPVVSDVDVPLIKQALDKGVDIVHLRKPDSNVDECRKVLSALTVEQRSQIIIHDYPELYWEFSLKGIHVNRNVTILPEGYSGYRTRSCHSFEEIIQYKDYYDYLFLSPIFDSISKSGYRSRFSKEILKEASEDGLIDEKVIALGGVTFDKIAYLKDLNFGGVAMIGGLYDVDVLQGLDEDYLANWKRINH